MKISSRHIAGIFLVIVALIVAAKWELVSYGLMQAKGQWEVISKAQPLEDFLESDEVPDSIKQKILLVNEIKSYAVTELNMPASDQYTKMYDQKGKDILWVVTASHPYQLSNYSWEFPFLGKVEYKGFFIYDKALELESELRSKGYDTRLRSVGAWSTLGWLNDPILSNVLAYSEGRLAEMIIHELTHDVVYIKDSVNFNENLASFIGAKGAVGFLQKHYPNDSTILSRYKKRLTDKETLNTFISGWLPRFKRVYQEIRHLSVVEKEQIKYETFENFKAELKEVQFFNPDYGKFIIENPDFNNAHLLSYKRYGGTQSVLEEEFKREHHSDLKKMLNYYATHFNSL
ncbi:aminopeptidase [Marivirga lumbricoides]|uniref:Aminopeptidase n=1 Tax=Marivirga lumbricoides TaxID=1046115 RepID=A0ABQ1LRC5_9BACT|nr:aminopeptidase [Marivirga lumbricoides]